MHRDGEQLVIEPVRKRGLVALLKTMKPVALLKTMKPVEGEFADIRDPAPTQQQLEKSASRATEAPDGAPLIDMPKAKVARARSAFLALSSMRT